MTTKKDNQIWPIYRGVQQPHDDISKLPLAPRWRQFEGNPIDQDNVPKASNPHYISSGGDEVNLVNAALFLRRPLLVTGKPGSGKSSLAYAIAHELQLGRVLYWPITSRTKLLDGLYSYDAIGRLQEAQLLQFEGKKEVPDIGKYIRLGPLGTALLPVLKPRVLLIDEIDKSDLDLPNDLLHVFEEGSFSIPELERVEIGQNIDVLSTDGYKVPITQGKVTVKEFPLVILTSNGEKEFPPAFLRRCLRYELPEPGENRLMEIVRSQLGMEPSLIHQELLDIFLEYRDKDGKMLATDQLLNALYIVNQEVDIKKENLQEALFKPLTND